MFVFLILVRKMCNVNIWSFYICLVVCREKLIEILVLCKESKIGIFVFKDINIYSLVNFLLKLNFKKIVNFFSIV